MEYCLNTRREISADWYFQQKHVRDSLSLRHRDLSNSPERAMPHLLAWKQTILENDLSIHHTPGNTRATSLRFRLSDPTDLLSGMRKLATSGQLSVQAAHLMPSQPKGLLGIRQFRVKLADRGIWMSSCGNKHREVMVGQQIAQKIMFRANAWCAGVGTNPSFERV